MSTFKKDDKIRVQMKPNGWVIGEVQFSKILDDGRKFYYMKPERFYKDGMIHPASDLPNQGRLMCIPAYVEGLIQGVR